MKEAGSDSGGHVNHLDRVIAAQDLTAIEEIGTTGRRDRWSAMADILRFNRFRGRALRTH